LAFAIKMEDDEKKLVHRRQTRMYLYHHPYKMCIYIAEYSSSVRLYLQLFVRYLRYSCMLAHSELQHILCFVCVCFVCIRLVYPMLSVFSGLFILNCLYSLTLRLLKIIKVLLHYSTIYFFCHNLGSHHGEFVISSRFLSKFPKCDFIFI
jgi:hypothetical protein